MYVFGFLRNIYYGYEHVLPRSENRIELNLSIKISHDHGHNISKLLKIFSLA